LKVSSPGGNPEERKRLGGNNPGGVKCLKGLFNPFGVVINNGYPIPGLQTGLLTFRPSGPVFPEGFAFRFVGTRTGGGAKSHKLNAKRQKLIMFCTIRKQR
jgi:hypothetical protein